MNVGNGAVFEMPAIALDRLTRTLVGPSGERVELPPLSLRLLDALAVSSPAFVGTEVLLQRVWPDTHISADALKQRVRLLRVSLTSAGYDPRLLDSARGEGYALRALLRNAPVDPTPPRRVGHSLARPARRWATIGIGAPALLLLFFVFRTGRSREAAPMGPSPVRIGIASPEGSLVGSHLINALAGNAHLLVVPAPVAPIARGVAECGASDRIHLCVRVTPVVGDTARVTLTLAQVTTGALLLRSEVRTADGTADVSPFVLQLAQFASPGVLRWIGGRTGAGDHAFTQFREGARLLGSCDVAARGDVIAGLRGAADRSPNFLPGRAMLAIHEMEEAMARKDTARVLRVMREAERLVAISADLALAHLAIARGAATLGNDSLARRAGARATRLQSVLLRFVDQPEVPRAGPESAARAVAKGHCRPSSI